MRRIHLLLQQLQTRLVQRGHGRAHDVPEPRGELRRRDGRDLRAGDVVGDGRRERRVVEEIAGVGRLVEDVGEASVAGADGGDGAGDERVVGGEVRGQVAGGAEGLEGGVGGGEGRVGVGLEVDPEVEGLAGGGVEDAVLGVGRRERRDRVLAVERVEDRVDVEGGEGAGGGEGAFFVADLLGSAVSRVSEEMGLVVRR